MHLQQRVVRVGNKTQVIKPKEKATQTLSVTYVFNYWDECVHVEYVGGKG